MTLQARNLDDLTFDDLLQEALASLPALNPAWTDHNPSDPGIAMIELLAWLVEMVIYRTGRTSEATTRAFLRLLLGRTSDIDDATPVDTLIKQALAEIRTPFRVVTPEDYEAIVRRDMADTIARVHCVTGADSVVLLVLDASGFGPSDEVLKAVKAKLERRQLITTKLFVRAPSLREIVVHVDINLKDDADSGNTRSDCLACIAELVHPLRGGKDGKGWPLGRAVRATELMAEIDSLPGVDTVEVTFADNDNDKEVTLEPDQLPTVVTPPTVTMYRRNRQGVWI